LGEFVDGRKGHKDHAAPKAALDAWFDEVRKARWSSAADVKRSYATASIISASPGEIWRRSSVRVREFAEVLNRKRGLSVGMIRRLHERLGISAEVLIRPSRKSAA
jgi:hypothetical protein